MVSPDSEGEWTSPDDKSLVETTGRVADDLTRGTPKDDVVAALVDHDGWPETVASGFVEQVDKDMRHRIAAADEAIGVNADGMAAAWPEGRSEKATWRSRDFPKGGRLTLTGDSLIWRRSRWPDWPWVGAPELLEIPLEKAAVSLGPRRPISSIYYVYTFLVLWVPGLLLLPVSFLFDLLVSGGHRRTMEVAFGGRRDLFSVRNVEGWLGDIATAKRCLSRGE